MRQYDVDNAKVRQNDGGSAIERLRQYDNTMTTVRQYDGDSAIVRWRQFDSTMTTMRQYNGDSAIPKSESERGGMEGWHYHSERKYSIIMYHDGNTMRLRKTCGNTSRHMVWTTGNACRFCSQVRSFDNELRTSINVCKGVTTTG
ncbi:hypothetical protein DPMN_000822 [Dreissena polymorpha]|uniref:Uncharacterized protein n=1 Tax=Dreissena polymorpha TaxID=45954 RepID=A0A9D4MJR8_DREPO|nr:hypothetical protein DPMN_000822 [Dreissena polymorpha]